MVTLFVAIALAAPPDGFRESVRLQPIASAIAGHPVYVYCARTEQAWQDYLRPFNAPVTVDGHAPRDNHGVLFAPEICRDLEGWLRGKSVPPLQRLGVSALTFTHEAVHTRGVDDERVTECAALRELPALLRRHFRVLRAMTLRKVMAAAWANHRQKSSRYQGCPT